MTTKKLWLVERTDDWDYDTFDSFVCVAESAEAARKIHPNGNIHYNEEKDAWYYRGVDGEVRPLNHRNTWVSVNEMANLNVVYLGVTTNDKFELNEVIHTSFNAG